MDIKVVETHSSGCLLKKVRLVMSPATVLVVSLPRPTAPANSKIAAIMIACQSFKVPEPTEVAKLRYFGARGEQRNLRSIYSRNSIHSRVGDVVSSDAPGDEEGSEATANDYPKPSA